VIIRNFDCAMIQASANRNCSKKGAMNSVIGRLPPGLSPTGGVIMGTRCGDLGPGVLVYLMRERNFDAAGLERTVRAMMSIGRDQ
jgi:hypothetical protein